MIESIKDCWRYCFKDLPKLETRISKVFLIVVGTIFCCGVTGVIVIVFIGYEIKWFFEDFKYFGQYKK